MTAEPDAPNSLGDRLAQNRTAMAMTRTRLALDRTLDAWIRTAVSLVGFGLTIYKFLQGLQESNPALALRPHEPRNVGLALVGLGTLGLIAAVYQHVAGYRELGRHPLRRPLSVALVIACLMFILAVLVFLSIALNVGPL